MVQKSAHPTTRLFEYLNGAVDEKSAQAIKAHLSVCGDCDSLARLVSTLKAAPLEMNRAGKSQITNRESQISSKHPDTGELANFFYAGARRPESSGVATHVALCGSCAEAIAQYARAEQAAAEYSFAKEERGEVPAKAWEMIRDWEESSFASLKPAREVLGQELLTRLAGALNARTREAREPVLKAERTDDTERIPVLVVDRSGEVRGVEFFEQVLDPTGAKVLKHEKGSQRFDNKLVLALLDLGETDSLVISELIQSDTLRLRPASRDEDRLRRVDFFIVEDGKD